MAKRASSIGAGAVGGVVAGTALSALFLLLERQTKQPSDLVQIGRKSAALLGSPYRHGNSMPSADEQLRYHGAHLALSALMGAVIPALRLRGVAGGALGGVGWYAVLHGLLGPRFDLVAGPFGEPPATASMRVALHAAFGVVSTTVAEALSRRDRP